MRGERTSQSGSKTSRGGAKDALAAGKEVMRLRSAHKAVPRRGNPHANGSALASLQSEEGGERIRDSEQGDDGRSRRWDVGITSQPVHPGQAIVSALCAGEHDRQFWRPSRRRYWTDHVQLLTVQHLHASPPMLPA